MTTDGRTRALIVAYVLAQMATRVLVGPSLELDEAEAMTFAQDLRLGYGAQPPLYFWLQWAVFRVLGETVLGLAALKAAILGGTLLLLFDLLRREVPTAPAVAATLSAGFLVQLSYESQRALTHTPFALLAAVAMAAALIHALRSGGWTPYLIFGVATGIGLMAKLNVALWAAGLVVAALTLPSWRARVRPARLLAAVGVALALTAPVLAWMAANPDLALSSADKFEVDGGVWARVRGLAALALAALSFNGPGLVAVGAAWAWGRDRARPGPTPSSSGIALLVAATIASLGLVALGLLVSGATEVRDRWLTPLSWALVPALVAWLWPALTPRAGRALTGAAASMWLLAAALQPYASLVDPGYRGSDWTGVEAALFDAGAGAGGLPVLSTHTWATGNLLLRDRVPGVSHLVWPADLPAEAAILLVPEGDALSDAVADRVESRRRVEVPRGDRTRTFEVLRLSAR